MEGALELVNAAEHVGELRVDQDMHFPDGVVLLPLAVAEAEHSQDSGYQPDNRYPEWRVFYLNHPPPESFPSLPSLPSSFLT